MEKDTKFEVIEGGKNHGKPWCDCPFCRCKCPQCGTKEVEIAFQPKWSISNDMEDKIAVLRQENSISVECPECGDLVDNDEVFFESNADLSNLTSAMDELLGLPYTVYAKYNDDGTIDIQRTT